MINDDSELLYELKSLIIETFIYFKVKVKAKLNTKHFKSTQT